MSKPISHPNAIYYDDSPSETKLQKVGIPCLRSKEKSNSKLPTFASFRDSSSLYKPTEEKGADSVGAKSSDQVSNGFQLSSYSSKQSSKNDHDRVKSDFFEQKCQKTKKNVLNQPLASDLKNSSLKASCPQRQTQSLGIASQDFENIENHQFLPTNQENSLSFFNSHFASPADLDIRDQLTCAPEAGPSIFSSLRYNKTLNKGLTSMDLQIEDSPSPGKKTPTDKYNSPSLSSSLYNHLESDRLQNLQAKNREAGTLPTEPHFSKGSFEGSKKEDHSKLNKDSQLISKSQDLPANSTGRCWGPFGTSISQPSAFETSERPYFSSEENLSDSLSSLSSAQQMRAQKRYHSGLSRAGYLDYKNLRIKTGRFVSLYSRQYKMAGVLLTNRALWKTGWKPSRFVLVKGPYLGELSSKQIYNLLRNYGNIQYVYKHPSSPMALVRYQMVEGSCLAVKFCSDVVIGQVRLKVVFAGSLSIQSSSLGVEGYSRFIPTKKDLFVPEISSQRFKDGFPRRANPISRTLHLSVFFKHLRRIVDDQEIFVLVETLATPIRLQRDPNQTNLNMWFMEFETVQQAVQIVLKFHDFPFEDGNLRISFTQCRRK